MFAIDFMKEAFLPYVVKRHESVLRPNVAQNACRSGKSLEPLRTIGRLLVVAVVLVLVACQSDEPQESSFSWAPESAQMLADGIKVGFKGNTLRLAFHNGSRYDVEVWPCESWLTPTITNYDEEGELTVKVAENEDMEPRQAEVVVAINGEVTHIRITQDGCPKVVFVKENKRLLSEGGDVDIRVKARGELSARLYPTECKWATIKKVAAVGNDEYVISFHVDKNEGLGRIVSFSFRINGQPAYSDSGHYLIQAPARFAEKTTVTVKKPGSLQVLLGDDVENLRRIRSLKLVGPINRYDFVVLRKLFLDSDESIRQYPVEVDLSECSIVAGYNNPFDYYGWIPSDAGDEVYLNSEIPSGLFSHANNLKRIVLPEGLTSIGRSAFNGCKNLEDISIPNSVEEINSKAFYECSAMKNIRIGEQSNVSTIGHQAFTTKSMLEDLTIPATAVNIAGEAFLGCTVARLHLKWEEPFEVSVVPQVDGCTLYVPKGTANLYRNTRNWSKFKSVIEE